ncbi:MAG: allantoicase, partial [Chitinophagaceae bacterium]
WESRRKRTDGHDWVVIKLGASGIIHGFDIDTNHFLGNHPPHASVEAVALAMNNEADDWGSLNWTEVLPKSALDAGSHNFFNVQNNNVFTHVRLHIYPDGGVARFRVYGTVSRKWEEVSEEEEIDLASALNGAKAIACNDMFFSSMDNLLMPGRGVNMGDGWETKRNRTPGNKDWVMIRLAHPGVVGRVLLDTAHFKGNYPDRFSLEYSNASCDEDCINKSDWNPLLTEQKLSADSIHEFKLDLPIFCKYVRLNIFPDGGVSRLRIFGKKKST